MFYAKNQASLPLCTAVKYTHEKNTFTDFSSSPRPCHNFVFMLEGEGDILASGAKIHVKKGDFLFIPKDTTYQSFWKATPKTAFHSIHFNFSRQNDPFSNADIPVQAFPLKNFDELYSLVRELQNTQYSKDCESFFALSAFYRLCGELLPYIEAFPSYFTENPVAPAIEYIENNYTARCTVEELANLCFLSPSRFYYLFKKQTGRSPIVFKNEVCIRRAAQSLLLEKTKTVEDVSDEYGFESAVYFRRLFKSVTGKTPTQYREEETLL